jgi:hypothetical protein
MSSSTSGKRSDSPAAGPVTGPIYRERMTPAPWVWGAGSLLGLLTGLTVFPIAPLLAPFAIVVFIGLIVTSLVLFSPVVTVTDGELVAGQASVPVALLGTAEVLDAVQMRHALGPGLDVRAYLCMRGWIPIGLRIALDDPDDPTPYWLITSRRPAELAAALEKARTGAGQAG